MPAADTDNWENVELVPTAEVVDFPVWYEAETDYWPFTQPEDYV